MKKALSIAAIFAVVGFAIPDMIAKAFMLLIAGFLVFSALLLYWDDHSSISNTKDVRGKNISPAEKSSSSSSSNNPFDGVWFIGMWGDHHHHHH